MKKWLLIPFILLLLMACSKKDEAIFPFTNYELTDQFEEVANGEIPIGEKIEFDEETYLVEILPTVALKITVNEENMVRAAAISVKPDAVKENMDVVRGSFNTLAKSVDSTLTDSDLENIYDELDMENLYESNAKSIFSFHDIHYKYECNVDEDSLIFQVAPK